MGGRGVKKQTFIMFAFAGWAALKIPQELLSRRCGNSEYSPQVFALLSSSVACCVLLVTAGIQNTIPKSLRCCCRLLFVASCWSLLSPSLPLPPLCPFYSRSARCNSNTSNRPYNTVALALAPRGQPFRTLPRHWRRQLRTACAEQGDTSAQA